MKYKVVETFTSIQGEGHHTGYLMFFIRFYGCNLQCSFCDEPKHTDKTLIRTMSAAEIVNEVERSGVKYVCLTGGEPSLTDKNELIEALIGNGIYVSVETNGHSYENIMYADWITLSPKNLCGSFEDIIPEGVWSEVKFVVDRDTRLPDSFERIVNVLEMRRTLTFVQPMNDGDRINKDNYKYAVELIKKYPSLRLSAQLHKLIGVE